MGWLGYVKETATPKDLVTTIDDTVSGISRAGLDFDTILCIGGSGLLVAPLVAARLSACLYIAQKENDHSHRIASGSGQIGSSILFIDDLISTGYTLRRALRVIDENSTEQEVKFVGSWCYGRFGAFGPGFYPPHHPQHHLVRNTQFQRVRMDVQSD